MLTPVKASLILGLLKPCYGDIWEVHPDILINNGITESDLRDHGAGLYCGTDRNIQGEKVVVFQKSMLEKYIGRSDVP